MHVFLSHSSANSDLAAHIGTYLERRGIRCWYTPRDVAAGADWDLAILDAIKNCTAMLVLFSGKADQSKHVRRELNLADQMGKFLLTLRLEDVQPEKLTYFLNLSQWIDWLDRRDETLERVYDTLGTINSQNETSRNRARTVSIPEGQKIWLRPSSSTFRAAPIPPRSVRVLTSSTKSKEAVGYLRMRNVDNGRYDRYHEVVREDGSLAGYFTDGFMNVAYTYGFVSPPNDTCIYILNHRFQATKSLLSILRPQGIVWTKIGAPKFAVTDRHVLAFEISHGNISHFYFRGDHGRDLFCMNGAGFFLFDTQRGDFHSNVSFDRHWLRDENISLSPKAPLVAVGISEFVRKGTLDDQEIYRSRIKIYHIETGDVMMSFDLPGDELSFWSVDFNEDGKMLKAVSGETEHVFDLVEVR